MKPKLDDVAKLANVSKTTVSRVLNKRGYLSQETIDKVYDAMAKLNYQPNTVARQLYNKKTQIIGLIFPTVTNPFFGELVEELEKKLYLQGYKVIIGNSMNDPEKETNYLNQLLSNQVDGLIVGTHNQDIEQYKNDNLPIVAIDQIMNEDIPIIESDNYLGGQLATERLINKGAKKIIHTAGPDYLNSPTHRRRIAYEDKMREHGLNPISYSVDFNIPYEDKIKIFNRIFKESPDVEGIFASNDLDAALIMNIAKNYNKKIPEDLLLVGYDGTKIMRTVFSELTTIIQPIDQISTKAIEVLNDRMENKDTLKEYIFPVSIWEGGTC
ncbi:LacI family DNA-binding transcriptional regulator [Mammaliicoccus sciuri]|uniref:LacI family DNA-binding transcriptional regulator n=1 Tax=Mammaliicoccus sciuri TaxID=1296 RepID=UPI00194DBC17|nr:LacI family DNA-binding transcriptional regulator [Mammaliicoccus sciuri]MCD8798380.1 LacI family DNA-binding transcriptional regulator [Mammaliicoccus sciuri]MCJ0920081.1 LacI family DNA-binding transcriptional regulator [Mammaliicoccus sciuri]MCJ0957780.1 LacI family DNA-binding transcriptional regulator [Mammaliicoccus sciuri]MCJ0962815.1 LacI family DNA-binding transcriptional regulator [Mammaliicoccus sciuri]MCJ1776637.1 LacI family DNA-binding transcriptional regulator [Mammaliicoccus